MLNNNPLVKGILIGVGVSVVGFCAYKHNEDKVDDFLRRHGLRTRLRRKLCEGSSEIIDFLRRHGVNVKSPAAGFETMSVEDLMRTKETIEDLIAEKEMQDQSVTVEAAPTEA